ncbi:MAG: outer membrane protein assembly factor BamD [Sphingomonadales bacterium]|nr:outer membrane protein assembly factor BamD [Sphingomonadales bacterium]MDE2168055.1 outer membrane protein assembly factor BamD [Sphingomonadales bacterium]
MDHALAQLAPQVAPRLVRGHSPRVSFLRIAALTGCALAAAFTAGCAGKGGKAKDTAYVARDVDSLYLAARTRLDQGDAKVAAALFDEVERQHPYSPWARRAQLMSAFSYYSARDYTKSIQAAQRFLSIHPGNKDAPYAYYLVALCYYEQIQDVTRDQKITLQALGAMNDVMRRYPNTRYAVDARLKIDLINDHLAGKEMDIGRYYERAGRWLAADIRFRNVIDKYSNTNHTAEALYRLVETSLAIGIPEEAQKYAAVLGKNYPGSEWYEKAYGLMKKYAPGTQAS